MSWISFIMSMKPFVSLSARVSCLISDWEDGVGWGAALTRATSARVRMGREKRMVMDFLFVCGREIRVLWRGIFGQS